MSFPARTPWMVTLVLFCVSITLQAQEPSQPPEGVPPESQYMYNKHYEEVQQILQAPLGEREAKLDNYREKLHPKSKILEYMAGFYGQLLGEYQKAGQNQKASALMAKMGQLFPAAAKAMQGQAFQQAFQSRNYAKAIELGEKLYAQNPDKQIAAILAQSYIATSNATKAQEYSTKTVQALGAKEGVYFAAWLARYHSGQGNLPEAVRHYDQIIQAFPTEGPSGWTAQGWSELKAEAHAVVGSDAYSKKDFGSAIRNFTESLQYNSKNATAYLLLGRSQWEEKKLDEAIDAFAKGAVLNQPNSAKAREYLEQIFKARNNDSTEGIDALLDAARQALGI